MDRINDTIDSVYLCCCMCIVYSILLYTYNAYFYMHTSFFVPMCCAMWYGSLVSSIGWCWMISWYVGVFVFCYCRLLCLLFVVFVVCCLLFVVVCCLFVCLFVCLLACLFVCLLACLVVCLFVCLFVCLLLLFFLIWWYQWVKVTPVFHFHVPLSLLTHRFWIHGRKDAPWAPPPSNSHISRIIPYYPWKSKGLMFPPMPTPRPDNGG